MPNERIVKIAVLFAVTMLLVLGCALQKTSRTLMKTPVGLVAGLPHPGENHHATSHCPTEDVPVFVVSGRNVEDRCALDPFGTERSQEPTLGIAYVKIGEGLTQAELHRETTTDCGHKKAQVEFSKVDLIEKPEELGTFEANEHVVRHGNNPWVSAIEQQLLKSQNRKVTIFVHGFNTEFIDNTLLAAEIYHYLGRQGAMISFEWPSETRVLGYLADKGNANSSTRQFRTMISNLAKDCQVDSITIIAHSAGSPIVVNALREIRLLENEKSAAEVREKYRVDRVVLAAPDMDLGAFINAIYDRFYEVATGIAVYASPSDRALRVSEILNGNSRLGRAVGSLQPWESIALQSASSIELIDAEVAGRDHRNFLGHSYFHRDPWISSDIGAFVLGRSIPERSLVRRQGEIFYRFPDDYPDRLRARATSLTMPRLN